MEANITYAILAALLVAFIVVSVRDHRRAMRGVGAPGAHITATTIPADDGWQLALRFRNISDAPVEVTYFVEATLGRSTLTPLGEQTRTIRLNPGIVFTDNIDVPGADASQPISRVDVYARRWDRTKRLLSRSDFA